MFIYCSLYKDSVRTSVDASNDKTINECWIDKDGEIRGCGLFQDTIRFRMEELEITSRNLIIGVLAGIQSGHVPS
jgi:hypothetical protein